MSTPYARVLSAAPKPAPLPMALQSKLFRGDPKLEAAAVSDPAHITIGAKGEHVRKIQQALTLLDSVNIDLEGAYGPETAAAVLQAKTKHR